MDECCREEHAGAEVSHGEEEAADREAGDQEGDGARASGHAEDDEERCDMEAEVVVCRLDLSGARIALEQETTRHGGVGDAERRMSWRSVKTVTVGSKLGVPDIRLH